MKKTKTRLRKAGFRKSLKNSGNGEAQMDKMWAGRFHKALDSTADDFNSSIHFDSRMYKQDISGSVVHAMMLARQGIIT